jgi:hypothetical protein
MSARLHVNGRLTGLRKWTFEADILRHEALFRPKPIPLYDVVWCTIPGRTATSTSTWRLSTQLRKPSDAEVILAGRATRQLVSPWNSNPPSKVFVVGLEECIAEWRRRHRESPPK